MRLKCVHLKKQKSNGKQWTGKWRILEGRHLRLQEKNE